MSLLKDLEILKEKIEGKNGNEYNYICEIFRDRGQACFLKVTKGKEARHIYPVGKGLFFFAPIEKGMSFQDIISKI